jgi:hypothetical protein
VSDGIDPYPFFKFFGFFSIHRAITAVDLAVLADNSSDSVPEVFSGHNVLDVFLVIAWLDYSTFFGDGFGGYHVVAGYHSDFYASKLTLPH